MGNNFFFVIFHNKTKIILVRYECSMSQGLSINAIRIVFTLIFRSDEILIK